MSEYQCHEFVALDRPLTARQMAELRAISSRAQISPTRFWNEYDYGDLKADPKSLLQEYFDAYLYFANWGTRRFMLRLPAENVNVAALKPYLATRRAKLTRAGAFVVLDFWSQDEDPDGNEDWIEFGGFAALTPLRTQILQGDYTAPYIAWLGSLQSGEMDDEVLEPPVPPGLASPNASVACLVELLRIDRDLLAAASGASQAPAARRTAGELLARAEALREVRRTKDAAAKKRAAAARARARAQALDLLHERHPEAWSELEHLIEARSYDKAVALAVDLRDLAQRDDSLPEFEARFAVLKKAHARRRGFFDAFKRRVPLS